MKKRIAAVSMCRNDSFFLERWISYYGKILGHRNLYLFIDGFDMEFPSLAKKVNCYQIPHLGHSRAKADRKRSKYISKFAYSIDSGIICNVD